MAKETGEVRERKAPAAFRAAMVFDERCRSHDTGGGMHPEIPQRLDAVRARLRAGGAVREVPAGTARWEWLTAVHEEGYLFRFEEAALSGRSWLDHGDNRLSYETYDAALAAAAAGPAGIDLLEGGGEPPFCTVRPPGHHAERARAMGFCFVNNAAVAARYWQQAHGRRRVLVVDWDAHHGNGTQAVFEEDPEVFYVSLHEHPTFSFPGTGYAGERGRGAGEGATLNIPLAPGSGDDELLRALDGLAEPEIESFAPEAIVVSAGFDGHASDDMSDLACSTELYRRLGERAKGWGSRCGGRVLSVLEGGYHLESLAAGVEAYLDGLAGTGG